MCLCAARVCVRSLWVCMYVTATHFCVLFWFFVPSRVASLFPPSRPLRFLLQLCGNSPRIPPCLAHEEDGSSANSLVTFPPSENCCQFPFASGTPLLPFRPTDCLPVFTIAAFLHTVPCVCVSSTWWYICVHVHTSIRQRSLHFVIAILFHFLFACFVAVVAVTVMLVVSVRVVSV